MKLTHLLIVAIAGGTAYVFGKRYLSSSAPAAQSSGFAGALSQIRVAVTGAMPPSGPPGVSPGEPGGTVNTGPTDDYYWNDESRIARSSPMPEDFATYAQQSVAGVSPYSKYQIPVITGGNSKG